MIVRLLNKLWLTAIEGKGKPCPRCGSTNTDQENGIWYCHDCKHEW